MNFFLLLETAWFDWRYWLWVTIIDAVLLVTALLTALWVSLFTVELNTFTLCAMLCLIYYNKFISYSIWYTTSSLRIEYLPISGFYRKVMFIRQKHIFSKEIYRTLRSDVNHFNLRHRHWFPTSLIHSNVSVLYHMYQSFCHKFTLNQLMHKNY
jgi:hypothetical protein